jgi:hypothetical protein
MEKLPHIHLKSIHAQPVDSLLEPGTAAPTHPFRHIFLSQGPEVLLTLLFYCLFSSFF